MKFPKIEMLVVLIISRTMFSAYGQIKIESGDLPEIGTVNQVQLDTSGVNVSGLTASGGENQTWTFTGNLNGVGNYTYEYFDPLSVSSGDLFSDATLVSSTYIERIRIPEILFIIPNAVDTLIQATRFDKISNDQVEGLGMELSLSLLTGLFRYNEPSTVFPLPLQYGSKWTETAQVDTVIADSITSIGDVPLIVKDSSEVEIDGWGTLTIGSGSYECLRLRYQWSRSILVSLFGLPMAPILPPWENIIYRWIAKDLGVILEVVSQDNETNPQFTEGAMVTRLTSSNVVVGIQCDPEICKEKPLSPNTCELFQNHPNPFNPTTQIQYSLPQPARVQLTVYSILGREIIQLESSVKNRGSHRVVWDGLNNQGNQLPSGVYIYQIRATLLSNGESFSQTKKMIMAD